MRKAFANVMSNLPSWMITTLKRLLTATLIGLVIYIFYRVLHRYDLNVIWREMRKAPIESLLWAGGITALNYLILTFYDALAFRYIRQKLSYSKIGLTAFMSYTFSHNVGAALVSGGAIRYRMYSRWGIRNGDIARVVIFSGFHFWAGLFLMGALAALFFPHDFSDALNVHYYWSFAIAAGLLVPILYYLSFTLKPGRALRWKSWVMEVPPLHLATLALIVACFDWLCAAAVLHVLLPDYQSIHYMQVLVGYLAAQMAGVASHVPGGLGVFEAVLFAALDDHYKDEALVGSLVLYRFCYYFIPFFLGMLTYLLYESKLHKLSIKNLRKKTRPIRRTLTAIVPMLLSIATFLAGGALLFSGASPIDPSRSWWVHDIAPLVLVEGSHLASSIIGVLLLALSFHLRRRLDAAYWMALLLLLTGAIGSFLKGLHYETAAILFSIFMLFILCRKHFYRKNVLASYSFSLSQFVAILVVIGASVWLGFLSYRHTEYSHSLWWEFAATSDAPRFLRTLVVMAIIALIVSLKVVVRAVPFRFSSPTEEELLCAEKIIQAQPSVETNIALLGDKQFLFNRDKTGFIMFRVVDRLWIALSEPVAPEDKKPELVWQFRELADQHGGTIVFYEVSTNSLPYFLDVGLAPVKLGESASIDLAQFSIAGNERKVFRNNLHRLQKEGITFEVIDPTCAGPVMAELREISDEWLAEKKVTEKGFSISSFSENYITHFPIAVVRKDQTIIAFANMWRTNLLDEISVDCMRHRSRIPNGIIGFLFINLFQWSKEKGFARFNVGTAPAFGFDPHRLAPLWSKVGGGLFRHGEHFYNFEGIRRYKEKFNPTWEPRYLVTPGGVSLHDSLTKIATLIMNEAPNE